MKKEIWRITPGIANGARVWFVDKVFIDQNGSNAGRSYGHFKTLKAAKSIIEHLKRKPIEI